VTKSEEASVIRRVLGGDKNAFAEIVKANQSAVYGLCLRMMKNEQDALDVSQDVFIKAYTSLSAFKGEASLSSWLYRITYNMCLDKLRASAKNATQSLSDEEDGEEMSLPDNRYEPEGEYAKKELRKALDDAIASLSEDHRQILLMREYSGLSYREIAERLGESEGTVKSRLSRARKAAAEYLIKHGTFPDSFRQKIENDNTQGGGANGKKL